ncbi:M20 family metallopeptidase [Streptomyces sp. NPDC026665]|uniref:M20 family metallopeptidase n=1 Tax=Streptomyces sp. NPDC026665 TaxID=3154798 RepID=UPI0033CC610B
MAVTDTAMPGTAELLAAARALQPSLLTLRRAVHEHPEIGLRLPHTQRLILDALRGLPLHVVEGRDASSITAVLEGARPGPTVVLRADMDALPLTEEPGAHPVSSVPGRMHACGHDLHAAMLVGAAELLSGRRFAGRVVFVWQPGEEGYDGMQVMLDEGLLGIIGPAPIATYALHTLADTVAHGVFTGRAGASHASSATVRITVRGRGGHAAFPHAAADPVPVAAEILTALQVRLTRAVDVFDPAILTIGSIQAGEAPNVIPDQVVMTGTARVFSAEQEARLPELVAQVVSGVAAAHGVEATTEYIAGYPVVTNDEAEVARFRDVITELFGSGRFRSLDAPIPAGDDYARLLQQIPGAFFLLGAGLASADGMVHANHSSRAVFDDNLLADGAAALAAVTLRRLSDHPNGEEK